VLLSDGTFECTLCGVILDIPEDKIPLVTDVELTGLDETCSIVIEGHVIHRCAFEQ
jgi:hypothetical protein